jgi:diaminopimelate decarboxylase
MHIGSQITDLAPFRNAFALLKELVGTLREGGFAIDFVNLGGGWAFPIAATAATPCPDYANLVGQVGDLG